jgi:hypothetical protein
MKLVSLIAAALAVWTYAPSARASGLEGCPVPPGAVKVPIPAGLPPVLRTALGNVALPGEPFDEIDVYVKGHKHSRYIFVWNAGSRWIVATERGGIALRASAQKYDLGRNGKTATLVEEETTFPRNVCAVATKLMGR